MIFPEDVNSSDYFANFVTVCFSKYKMMRSPVLLLFISMFLVMSGANAPAILPVPSEIECSGAAVRRDPGKLKVTVICPDSVRKAIERYSVISEIIGDGCRVSAFNKLREKIAPESYRLTVKENNVDIRVSDYRGFVYALQTLGQLLGSSEGFPCNVTVADGPRCGWRGFMLDSGRQFQTVDGIKKYIRMASMLKMNVFHWHLTEGLGWRPEIEAFPRLTKVGGYVAGGVQQQGSYSKKDIRDVVAYAGAYGIDIMPEIDLPGHSEAALKAYPELGCFMDSVRIPETGFTDRIFCAGKDTTLAALKIILDEICGLFPGKYIHLGGDEAPKGQWEKCPDCQNRIRTNGLKDTHDLQLWLSAQLASHLKTHGRKAVFWGDVVYSPGYPLPDNSVIQWWNYRGHRDLAVKNALAANHEVILSPNYYCYLNFPLEPWRGYGPERTFTMKEAYLSNPADAALASGDRRILGVTCALWTDYNLTQEMLDSRLFPRIFAISEIMWHKGERKQFDEFRMLTEKALDYFRSKDFDIDYLQTK